MGGRGGTRNQPESLSGKKRVGCIPDRAQEGVQRRESESREELDARKAEVL